MSVARADVSLTVATTDGGCIGWAGDVDRGAGSELCARATLCLDGEIAELARRAELVDRASTRRRIGTRPLGGYGDAELLGVTGILIRVAVAATDWAS